MKVVIAMDAFADDTQWRFLDQIICKVIDGWHDWHIEDPKSVEETEWLKGKGRDWLRELFQKAALATSYPRASWSHQRLVLVSSLKKEPEALPPKQAAEYASAPLAILMENRFTDGIFLDTALNLLASDEVNEQRRIAPSSIYYDSPGGNGELPKLIIDYATRAKTKDIPIRVVVFTESDGTVPGENQKAALLIQQTCEQEGVPFMILRKKTIENYIPDEILDAWSPNPSYGKYRIVDAVKKLCPEQRDHYPMKNGLKFQNASLSVQALYSEISVADMGELAKGLGKNVIENLRVYSDIISADALRQRDGHGELDRLVKMVADEL